MIKLLVFMPHAWLQLKFLFFQMAKRPFLGFQWPLKLALKQKFRCSLKKNMYWDVPVPGTVPIAGNNP